MRKEDKERVLTEVQSRIVGRLAAKAQKNEEGLAEILAESIFTERKRLREEKDSKERSEGITFWRDIQKRMNRGSEREHRTLLREIVNRYSNEICGNFDERVYKLATRVGPAAMGLLVNAVSPKRLLKGVSNLPKLDDAVVIQGETEHMRRLHELGTVIVVPNHVSNLDSIILGFSIYGMGMPPLIYGAGLNLFSNPLISYFMHNLGAYTVDRRKKDRLYKNVLKEYATLTLEHGYNNLFFPGGTRSRSGAIERKLKLGLLGTGIEAYINNLKRGSDRSKIFIVPATLSFQLVLEAETLIDDFLKEVGKSRYIITDDEFSKPKRVFDFVNQKMALDSKLVVTFSRGIDPFGNLVDDDGNSLDPKGRTVASERYVLRNGQPETCPQRDKEYTREVGLRIMEAYTRDNVLQATHITAHAVFTLLRLNNRKVDLIRLLRIGGGQEDMELRELYREMDIVLAKLREMESQGRIRLVDSIRNAETQDIVAEALKHFAIYHQEPAIVRKGDRIFVNDRNLVFYYQNRTEGYDLASRHNLGPALDADHLRLGGR